MAVCQGEMPEEPTIQEFDVDLKTGGEWHSKPIRLRAGTEITLTATGSAPFYAGVFPREKYVRLRRADLGTFGFEFGTDRPSYTTQFVIERSDDYYIVFRVGVFSPAQSIHVRWIVGPGPAQVEG